MISRLLAVAALAAAPGLARAQDSFALSYGINFTTNYIDDGATQSDDKPAVQGYVEGSYGMFYAGVWSSTVDFGESGDEFDDDRFEFDLSVGIRPTFGDLWLDLNYTRYIYDDSGNCCGDIILIAGYPVADFIEVTGEVDWDPEQTTTWTQAGAGVTFGDVWLVGGNVGTDFGTEEWGERDKVAFDFGVSRGLGDIGTVDLRYHDSNYDPGRVVLSIGADF
jgi:uncharacterized protein (TIGR02001 family)